MKCGTAVKGFAVGTLAAILMVSADGCAHRAVGAGNGDGWQPLLPKQRLSLAAGRYWHEDIHLVQDATLRVRVTVVDGMHGPHGMIGPSLRLYSTDYFQPEWQTDVYDSLDVDIPVAAGDWHLVTTKGGHNPWTFDISTDYIPGRPADANTSAESRESGQPTGGASEPERSGDSPEAVDNKASWFITFADGYIVAGEEAKNKDDAASSWRDAESACTDVLELHPSQKWLYAALSTRAYVRLLWGKFDAGLRDCDEAIRLDPNRGAAYDTRARLRDKKGDSAGAKADREKADQLKAANPPQQVPKK